MSAHGGGRQGGAAQWSTEWQGTLVGGNRRITKTVGGFRRRRWIEPASIAHLDFLGENRELRGWRVDCCGWSACIGQKSTRGNEQRGERPGASSARGGRVCSVRGCGVQGPRAGRAVGGRQEGPRHVKGRGGDRGEGGDGSGCERECGSGRRKRWGSFRR